MTALKDGSAIAFVQTDIACYASKGEMMFGGEVIDSVSVIGGLYPETVQLVTFIGIVAKLLTLEAARRTVGLPIIINSTVFLIYAFYGCYFPGFLAHRGQDLKSVVQLMFYTTDGILGTPISVYATFILKPLASY